MLSAVISSIAGRPLGGVIVYIYVWIIINIDIVENLAGEQLIPDVGFLGTCHTLYMLEIRI